MKQNYCPQRCLQRPRGLSYPMSPHTAQKHTDWFGLSINTTFNELLLCTGPLVLELSQSARQTGCPPLSAYGEVSMCMWGINIGHCSEGHIPRRTGVCPQFTQSPSQAGSCPRLVISADLLPLGLHSSHTSHEEITFHSLNMARWLSPASVLCTFGFFCRETSFWKTFLSASCKPQFR